MTLEEKEWIGSNQRANYSICYYNNTTWDILEKGGYPWRERSSNTWVLPFGSNQRADCSICYYNNTTWDVLVKKRISVKKKK